MSFWDTFRAECKMIFSNKAIILTIIGGVILYSFLYPQPYSHKNVSKLGISVVDYDHSDMSRSIIYSLDATPQISVIRRDLSQKDAKEALISDEIKAIVIIPPHFKRDILLNKSPTIAVGADSSYFLVYGGVLEGAMKSVLTQGVSIKVASLLKAQVPLVQAKRSYTPYSLNIINLFNPNNSYTQYVIPAVFVLILQQTLLIGLGLLGGSTNEKLSSKESGYLHRSPIWQIFLSRYLIFGSIFFVHMLFYFGFSFELFDVSRLANISDLLAFGISFLVASISLGILIGTLFNSPEIATPAILFSSLPLVFSVGFIWPLESIPPYIHYLSLLSPSTPAINGFLSLNQMGASLDMVGDDMVILWIESIVYLALGYLVFGYRRES